MLPDETVSSGGSAFCDSCKTRARLGVYHSNAGYYVGYRCNCGPYSRESGYYASFKETQRDLNTGDYHRQE